MDSKKRENSTTFIKNIVSSIGKSTNNFVFIKHYGKYSIDPEDARNAMMAYDDIEIYYTHFANNEMVGSFEPFLTIIKNCYIMYYSDQSIDDYLSKFDIYPLQKSFFKSYIDSGLCERYEPYILDEIGFEKKKIVESMLHIIMELSKEHPMLIMIDNIHMLPNSTMASVLIAFERLKNTRLSLCSYSDLAWGVVDDYAFSRIYGYLRSG